MTTRVPRQQRGEQRRHALLTAAIVVLAADGPGGFSARAVAQQAHLPLGAVSYYFPALDDLLGEALAAVLHNWLDHGESIVATTSGSGIDSAATAITAAVLPSGSPRDVRNRYEHLLAAAGNPVAAPAMAGLRPALESLIARILAGTGVNTPLSTDALLAIVDGAALGAVSEGAADPNARVRATLREVLRDTAS